MVKHTLSAPRFLCSLREVEARWLINSTSLHKSEKSHDVQHPIAELKSYVGRQRVPFLSIRSTEHLVLIRQQCDVKLRYMMLNYWPRRTVSPPSAHRSHFFLQDWTEPTCLNIPSPEVRRLLQMICEATWLPRSLIHHTAAVSHDHRSWWMTCLRANNTMNIQH